MPHAGRPDGAKLYWEQRGEGPLVVLAPAWSSHPSVYDGLIEDLARDHRVVRYDIRGAGQSTRTGPYDPETDAADLAAVADAAGGDAIAVAFGDGVFRAVRVAARSPGLVRSVVGYGNPLGPGGAVGTESVTGSDAVLNAFEVMIQSDLRSAVNAITAATNPELDDQAVHKRVDLTLSYCDEQAGVARLRAVVRDEAAAEAGALGDRLWLLGETGNPLFSGDIIDHVRTLLPAAHVEELSAGAISRPDLTAAVVRLVRPVEA